MAEHASPPFPQIAEVVPHSGAMILLDRIVAWTPSSIRCEVVLRRDTPFLERGRATNALTLELMAQAVAAQVGVGARGAGAPIEIGYLIGVREARFDPRDLTPGERLSVDVEHVFGDDRLGQFRARVLSFGSSDEASATAGDLRADAVLTVYRGALPAEEEVGGRT